MVIRGKPRGNGRQLGNYLLARGANECVQVFDIRGTSQPNDLKKSLIEMSLTSELTRSNKGLYHAQINPAYGEDRKMSREDWLRAAEILETELKLAGQKRVMVLHEKQGRIHVHVVWERYDHEKGRMISDSYSRLAQDRARQTMEKDLEHSRTPERNPNRPEMKKCLTDLWSSTSSGKEFIKEALTYGYIVAQGLQRRPFMVVDKEGRSFDLVRQLDGTKTKEVRERFKEEKLVSEKEAIGQVRQQQESKQKQVSNDNKRNEKLAAQFAENRNSIFSANLQNKAEQDRERLLKDFTQSNNDVTQNNIVEQKNWNVAKAFAENKEDQVRQEKERWKADFLAALKMSSEKNKGKSYHREM